MTWQVIPTQGKLCGCDVIASLPCGLWIIFGDYRPRGIAEVAPLSISKGLVNAPLFVHFYRMV
jgi:hypothetical protein